MCKCDFTDERGGLCRDLDHKLASTEAQVNELRAHLASASGSGKPSPVFRISGSPIPGPFQLQSSMIPRSVSVFTIPSMHTVQPFQGALWRTDPL